MLDNWRGYTIHVAEHTGHVCHLARAVLPVCTRLVACRRLGYWHPIATHEEAQRPTCGHCENAISYARRAEEDAIKRAKEEVIVSDKWWETYEWGRHYGKVLHAVVPGTGWTACGIRSTPEYGEALIPLPRCKTCERSIAATAKRYEGEAKEA